VVYARPIAGINSAGDPLVGNNERLSGRPFTLGRDDTIPGRKWRVVDGLLQCEAGGGWKDVFRAADGVELSMRLAWLADKLRAVDELDTEYGANRVRNDLDALRPPVPKWGKRSSPGARRLPPGSRATHQNGLEYHGAVARAEAA
jgi:hypothetical protein